VVSAQCEYVGEMPTALRDIFRNWSWSYSTDYNAGRLCDSNLTRATAAEMASEAAKLWVSALEKIHCDGSDAFGCGWGLPTATAASFGKSVAEAFAISIENAGAYLIGGWCSADVREVEGTLGEAERARADVCSVGGSPVEFQRRYVELTVEHVAVALMAAARIPCDGEHKVPSLCSPDDMQDDDERSSLEAANGSHALWCDGTKSECCSHAFRNSRFCKCKECSEPLRLHTREKASTNTPRKWADTEGNICICNPDASKLPQIRVLST